METINIIENDDFSKIVGKNCRLIGIDPGKKNIGIAICDPSQKLATPLKTIILKKFKKFVQELNSIIVEYQIKGIVVGNPINLNGSNGPRSQSAMDFAKNISKITKLPLTLWDERLSSEGAFKMMSKLDINTTKKLDKLDENAAGFILQGYLDYLNK